MTAEQILRALAEVDAFSPKRGDMLLLVRPGVEAWYRVVDAGDQAGLGINVFSAVPGYPPPQYGEPEAIVRALAAMPMLFNRDGGCALCDEDYEAHHAPDCPWRLAVEWAAAHPATDRSTP